MPDIVIAFFCLGLLAGLIKSDLKVPAPVHDTLGILLMLVLGLKGGMSLHGQLTAQLLWQLLPIGALGLALPLLCYPVLRRLALLSRADAASIAAHYGSVSAGTFAVVLALAEQAHLAMLPTTTLFLVMLELPAIVMMLCWYRHLEGAGRQGAVLREAFSNRGVILLGGGVLIGYAYGPAGLAPLAPVLLSGFKTMLAVFLLEMGVCAAQACRPAPWRHWRLVVFALLAPLLMAWAGIALAVLLGLPEGSALVLAGLAASASYIAAPAAVRAAIPQADLGLAMLAALGLTFPFNVLIGLGLYRDWVHLFY